MTTTLTTTLSQLVFSALALVPFAASTALAADRLACGCGCPFCGGC